MFVTNTTKLPLVLSYNKIGSFWEFLAFVFLANIKICVDSILILHQPFLFLELGQDFEPKQANE